MWTDKILTAQIRRLIQILFVHSRSDVCYIASARSKGTERENFDLPSSAQTQTNQLPWKYSLFMGAAEPHTRKTLFTELHDSVA